MSLPLAYDGRYAGIFIAFADPSPLTSIAIPFGAARSLYRSPRLAIAVLLADEHPEPVLSWLQSAHDACNGSSFLASVLATGAEIPDHAHCHLLRMPLVDLDAEFASELAARTALVARLPFSNEILILCDQEAGRELCVARSSLRTEADFGLAMVESGYRSPPVRRSPSPRYDPVGAQAIETLRGTAGTFEDNLAQVRRLLKSIFAAHPPAEVLVVEREVRRLLAVADQRRKEMQQGAVDEEVALTALDIAAEVGTDLTERLGRLADQLSVHEYVPDPWAQPIPYARAAEPYALRAVRAVVDECAERVRAAHPPPLMVPVLGDRLSNARGLLGPLRFVVKSPHPAGALITYPRRYALRAGALPSLAGAVAAAQCDFAEVTPRFVDGDLRSLGRALGARLDEGTDEEAREAGLRVGILLADLVATRVMGPAYVFALARFTPASMSRGPALRPPTRTPSLEERISLCVRLLRRHRMSIGFASQYVRVESKTLPAGLADVVDSFVSTPFDGRAVVVRRATDALAQGKVVDASPSLLLNALWRAVVLRSGYLNEVALFESLVRA